MEYINFETYFARVQAARRELMTLEAMCLAGNVGQPLGDEHNGLATADDVLAIYVDMARRINDALAQVGITR